MRYNVNHLVSWTFRGAVLSGRVIHHDTNGMLAVLHTTEPLVFVNEDFILPEEEVTENPAPSPTPNPPPDDHHRGVHKSVADGR